MKQLHHWACAGLVVALTVSGVNAQTNKAPAAPPGGRAKQKALRPGEISEPSRRVVYKAVGERKLELHLFEPVGHKPSDRSTCFVAINGGGWVGGQPSRFYRFAEHFARLGCVGVSVEYRLVKKGQETTVVDCVQDGRSTVRYLRGHAGELGIDSQKIVVSGGSADGQVAAATALFDGIDEPGDDLEVSCGR